MHVTLDIDNDISFQGTVKNLGKSVTHISLTQKPPLGAGGRLSIRDSQWPPAADTVTADCIIGSVTGSKSKYDVSLLIDDWDENAMRMLFVG